MFRLNDEIIIFLNRLEWYINRNKYIEYNYIIYIKIRNRQYIAQNLSI